MKRTGVLFIILMAMAVNGCDRQSSQNQPTPNPTGTMPVIAALTTPTDPQASPTLSEVTSTPEPSTTAIPFPSPFPNTPTLRPPVIPSPTTAPAYPSAAIQIIGPGPASKVVSPLQVNAILTPAGKGIVRLELLGEDGRLLVRQILSYNPGIRVQVFTKLEFEIHAVAEVGLLLISSEDQYGRYIAQASVDLVLLSMGESDLNPPGSSQESIIIQQPAANTLIQGGTVKVYGLARPVGKEPFTIDLVARDGTHVGPTRLVAVPPSPDGSYATFSTDLPYSVDSPTWVRLEVTEYASRIPSPTHLSSIEILLSP